MDTTEPGPAALPRRRVIAVLCSDSETTPPLMAEVEQLADVRYTDAEGLAATLVEATALFVWDFFSTALRDAWPSAGRLEWIHVASAGVDTLLFPELVASPVVVTNARGIFDRPIAEYVLAAVLAVAKDLPATLGLQGRREWRHRETRHITGATALVVGTGGIGREIARLLGAVGMTVRGVGRTGRADDPDFGEVIPSSELADHAGWADHLVIAAPLTDATRGLVGMDVLAAMKPGSNLINVGRGPIVDEGALIEALRSGPVSTATLDVFSVEPLPADSPLWSEPGVVVSPHLAGDAVGWTEALSRQFVDNARRWISGEPLLNVVDKARGYVPGTGS